MPNHMCGPPPPENVYGSVWACDTCGTAWELAVRFKNGPDPIGPGRWVRMKDTQAPWWAQKYRRKIRDAITRP